MAAYSCGHTSVATLISRSTIPKIIAMLSTTPGPLMHSTYFSLGANYTTDIAEAYMADALDYLSTSKGIISFWIGQRAADMERPQNDQRHDLAMHQLFKDEASFNLYNGDDPRHKKFVADVNRWAPSTTRRVIDTYLSNFIVGGNPSTLQTTGPDGNLPQSLFHSIYFLLFDKSLANIEKFTGICVDHLLHHSGIQMFATGGLTDITRDVSVRNFDVGIDIVFESEQAYDNYLQSKDHDTFFSATSGMIDNTYIFDSYLKYQSKVYSLCR